MKMRLSNLHRADTTGTCAAQVHRGSLFGILPEPLFRDVREALHLLGFSVSLCAVNSDILLRKKKSLEIGGGNKTRNTQKLNRVFVLFSIKI